MIFYIPQIKTLEVIDLAKISYFLWNEVVDIDSDCFREILMR